MPGYSIRVDGHLAPHWAQWLAGLELRHERDGTTTLRGHLPDQSALFGVLTRIRDLNLLLLAVERVGTDNGADAPIEPEPESGGSL